MAEFVEIVNQARRLLSASENQNLSGMSDNPTGWGLFCPNCGAKMGPIFP